MNRYLDEWIREKHGIGSRAELDAYIERKLSKQRTYAEKNSPWYEEHLKSGTPFMTVEDVRGHGSEMVCVKDSRIARVVTTSGTSGRPKRIFFTEADLELTVDYFSHGMRYLVSEGDKAFILFPGENRGSLVRLLEEGLARIGVSAAEKMDETVTCIIGSPMDVLSLSREGWRSVRTVLLSSAYVDEKVRKEIEDNLSCEVFEHYGMTEMGLGCAVSCGAEGYHIRENDIYIEIIDPVTGEVLPDGEWGEIVFTSLNREAMPFIRYRTGDISRILPPCSCGSFLRRLDKVKERKYGKSD